MKVSEKIKALAGMYETSPLTIRWLITQGDIEGAYAIRHEKRTSFVFSPELTRRIQEWK